jgi:hypothetical protein
MGGLFKQSTGQMASPVNPFVNTAMGETIQKWLESTGFAPKPKAAPEPSIFDNPFTQAMQLMFSVPKPEPQPEPANPFLDNPFARAFQEMMAGLQQPAAKAPEPPKEEPKTENDSYTEMLNAMFDSGLEVQKSYQKSLEAIFEAYRPKTAPSTNGPSPTGASPTGKQ